MLKNPAVLHALLEHLADGIADYACHQAACGAQVHLHTSFRLHCSSRPCFMNLGTYPAPAALIQHASRAQSRKLPGQLRPAQAHSELLLAQIAPANYDQMNIDELHHCCCSCSPFVGLSRHWELLLAVPQCQLAITDQLNDH